MKVIFKDPFESLRVKYVRLVRGSVGQRGESCVGVRSATVVCAQLAVRY